MTVGKVLFIMALAGTLVTHPHVSAAQGPEVHCVAVAGTDGLVQLDCYGPVMAETYERLVPRWQVYEALAPIAQEFSFDLTWTEEGR
jgi:hypothetical protein